MNADLARKERSVLGTIIDTFPVPVPPPILKLLQHAPESFDDHRHGIVARAISDLCSLQKPVHSVALYEYLNAKKAAEPIGGIPFIAALVQDALSIQIATVEAEDIWTAYQQRKSQSVLADASAAIQSSPQKTEAIIRTATRTLEDLSKEANGQVKLTFRQPSEFLSMSFPQDDIILGDHLFALGQSLVIAGAGGTGKSRLVFQLLACVVSRQKFLALDTGNPNMRWLVIQTENSNRRLADDMRHLNCWLNGTWSSFDLQVHIHTIENDIDSFVSLDHPDHIAKLTEAIEDLKPDGIAIDPLNDFAAGDLNKDADMKNTLMAFTRLARRSNPNRALLVSHHAITGRAGAMKTTGYDRASFARNSKVLHAWARGQINITSVDEDNNDRLIFACGKCSNGPEFIPFAARLNHETMIYECDPTVDVKCWQQTIEGKEPPLVTPDTVADFCGLPKTRSELSNAIREASGCSRATSYRHIARAESVKTISFNKQHETYVKNSRLSHRLSQ